MSKTIKLKCKLGLHNWKITDRICEAQLKIYLKDEIQQENNPNIEIPSGGKIKHPYASKNYIIKICRHCEKLVDNVTPAINKLKPIIRRDMELQRKADEYI